MHPHTTIITSNSLQLQFSTVVLVDVVAHAQTVTNRAWPLHCTCATCTPRPRWPRIRYLIKHTPTHKWVQLAVAEHGFAAAAQGVMV